MIAKITPVINLNGTDKESLKQQWMDVLQAARELDKALAFATPHGRDYPNGNYPEARKAHEELRMRSLAMITDAMNIAIEINNQ